MKVTYNQLKAQIDDIMDSKAYASPEMQSFWDNELKAAWKAMDAFVEHLLSKAGEA